jgi:hypothetical protein
VTAVEEGSKIEKVATASADETLLWDWLIFQAGIILERGQDNPSAEAIIKLAELMRRGIDARTASKP